MRTLILTAAAIIGGAVTGHAPAQAPDELYDLIVQRNRDLERDFNAGRLADVAMAYTDDAVVAGPDGYRIEGRAAIDAYWLNVGEPVEWDLEVFDVEAADEVSALQTGRSTLRARRDGQDVRTSVVLFEIVWVRTTNGEWRIARDVYWREDFDYAPGIRRVLQADSDAGVARNHASESRPIGEAVAAYVEAMDDFDYAGTPGDFADAMRRHRNAWAASIPPLSGHAEARGEMHTIWEALTAEGAAGSSDYQRLLDDIWSTWGDVARAAARHGVDL